MFRRTMHSLLLQTYALLFTLVAMMLRLLAPLNRRLAAQLKARSGVAQLAPRLALERARFRHCVVFFCSSAGEFEQAKPLIARLTASGSVFVHVIFFSQSGLAFAQARNETVSSCLSPLTDTVSDWGWLFSALRPTITCVVRHELWPGFLTAARRFGQLYLIDASCSQGERQGAQKRRLRSYLLRMFDGIYTVSPNDSAYFHCTYGIAAERLSCVGDSKYDRVLERAKERTGQIADYRALLALWSPKPEVKRLVLGSAYAEEVSLWLAARALRQAEDPLWQIVIAPHHLRPEFLDDIEHSCQKQGLSTVRMSAIQRGLTPGPQGAMVVFIDSMGILSEVYGTATAALVGGALHHQVHNVLEPACHGLALAFGPAYKNSQEAIHLVDQGLATVVATAADLAAWWRQLDNESQTMTRNVQSAVAGLAGASDRIMTTWRAHLGS